MNIYHYIVTYDEINGWQLDTEAEEVKYPDGTIWDDQEEIWLYGYQGDGKFIEGEEELTSKLESALDKINKEKK